MPEATLRSWNRNNLLEIAELSAPEIRYILSVARAFTEAAGRGQSFPLLTGKTVVHLFLENSTRTRMSFEAATRRLGGSPVSFAAASSSVSKGETLIDTAKNIGALGAHCFVVRHAASGSPRALYQALGIPVVNAGDGTHEHPTQALLDLYTMERKLGSVEGKKILIIGDIAHSRVARSNIHALKKLGAQVMVSAPYSLLPPEIEKWGVECFSRPEEALPQADAVMVLRIQLERQKKGQLPSLSEFARYWGLNEKRRSLLSPKAVILHPGPMNRGVEIAPEVADGPQSVILEQVSNGVWVRMAVLAATCNPEGLNRWMIEGGFHV